MAYKIYLAGGMTGLSEEDQVAWRQSVKTEIEQYVRKGEIVFFDPTEYDASEYTENIQHEEEAMMKLDIRNLVESNLVICNISTNPFSVGTNIELGICHNTQIPVVTYNPDNKPIHPWQLAISDFVVSDLSVLAELVIEYYYPRDLLR